MNDRIVPVYVLAGFLGSGKTTLLNRLLADAAERGWKPAVLMNEVGDVNLDGMVVARDVPMAEMLGGCICCSIKGDLGMELTKLARDFEPDVIWIESTGLANPLEIMDAVTESSLYAKLVLQGVVTVVDAPHLLDRLRIGSGKTFKLMKEQIRAASHLVLNKIDLVPGEELGEVEAALAEWNDHAKLTSTVRSEVEADWVYDGAGAVSGHEFGVDQTLIGVANDEAGHAEQTNIAYLEHSHEEEREHTHNQVNVVTQFLNGAVDSVRFEAFLKELPAEVFRAKGIVTFRDTVNRYLFQYAYKETDFVPITPRQPVNDVAVFIGEGFSGTELTEKLNGLVDQANQDGVAG